MTDWPRSDQLVRLTDRFGMDGGAPYLPEAELQCGPTSNITSMQYLREDLGTYD
jgi:hypothetical protein